MDLEDEKTCSRCEKPLDSTGYPQWCMKCRAAYKKEYSRTQKDMTETRGFASGISACKEFLAQEFERRIAGSPLTGFDVARFIRTSHGPDVVDRKNENPPIAQRVIVAR